MTIHPGKAAFVTTYQNMTSDMKIVFYQYSLYGT